MQNKILEKIKKAAELDKQKRLDARFLKTMAFLTRKGALKANRNYDEWYVGKLYFKDAVWAGKNLEPRILEVLPAMALRLPKEIVLKGAPKTFLKALEALKANQKQGPDFMGVPYDKYKAWVNLELEDKRTKPMDQKKIMRSFRLSPRCIEKLKKRMDETGSSGSEVIESLL